MQSVIFTHRYHDTQVQDFLGKVVQRESPDVFFDTIEAMDKLKLLGHKAGMPTYKTFDGKVMEVRTGIPKYPVRVFYFLHGRDVWFLYACKKNKDPLPRPDREQVMKRLKSRLKLIKGSK